MRQIISTVQTHYILGEIKMELREFLELTASAIGWEEELSPNDKLEDIEYWDSLGVLTLVNMLDQHGFKVDIADFEDLIYVSDYLDLVGINYGA